MKLLASAALAAGFLVLPAAHAQQAPVRVTIPHADLDLSRPSDVARLDARITDAVRTGCRSPEPIAFGAREAAHGCRVKARESARAARDVAVTRAERSALAYVGH